MAVLLAGGGVIVCVTALAVLFRHHLFLLAVTQRWPERYDVRMRQREVAARLSHRRPIAHHLSCRACGWTSSTFSAKHPPRWLAAEARHHARIVHATTAPVDDRFDVVADGVHAGIGPLPQASPDAMPQDGAASVVLRGVARAAEAGAGAVNGAVDGAQAEEPPSPEPATAPPRLVDLVDAMAALIELEQPADDDPHELADRLMDLAIRIADGDGRRREEVVPAGQTSSAGQTPSESESESETDAVPAPPDESELVPGDALAG